MTNARFRELAPGVTVELIATRIEFNYTPNGLETPEALTATWWAQEFMPVGAGYQRIGDGGMQLRTVLADHATEVLTIDDPVTGQSVSLSAVGAVQWLKKWFDHQCNAEAPNEDPADPAE